jgi:hypothetical protein
MSKKSDWEVRKKVDPEMSYSYIEKNLHRYTINKPFKNRIF